MNTTLTEKEIAFILELIDDRVAKNNRETFELITGKNQGDKEKHFERTMNEASVMKYLDKKLRELI